jgi:hypothetical protein
MIPTRASDDIADFLRFYERLVGRDAAARRTGAAPGDIDKFERLVRLPLPPLYVGYLREFGEEDSVLRMADDSTTRVAELIRFHAQQSAGASTLPPDSVAIGVRGVSGDRVLLYDESPDPGATYAGAEPSVVVSLGGSFGDTCASTFRNYLYRQAFVRGRLRDDLPFASMYRTDDDRLLDAASAAAAELGFGAYWFSDDYQVCLERADGAALLVARYEDRTSLYLCAPQRRARDEVKTRLLRELGLRDSSPADA